MAEGFAQEAQRVSDTRFFNKPRELLNVAEVSDKHPHGISSDGQLSWTVTDLGCTLEIWLCDTGRLYSTWSSRKFGTISCVVDISCGDLGRLFLVGLSQEDGTGGLVILNPAFGAGIRWIPLTFAVSAVHCLSSGDPVPKIDTLINFVGVAAVGGRGGNLMLIDLQLDQLAEASDFDMRPKELLLLEGTVEQIQEAAPGLPDKDKVFAIDITARDRGSEKFNYCNSDPAKTRLMEVENGKAYISSISYIPQLLTLFIGYNFGGFQLYNLRIVDIVCTSRVDNPTTLESVTHVTYQEPDDDPRLYVYLWVVYGPSAWEYKPSGRSRVVLYQLHYLDREECEEVGYVYRHLQGCMPRFEHLLGTSPKHAQASSQASQGLKTRVIFCKTLSHLRKQKKVLFNDKTVTCDNMTLAGFGWTAEKAGEPSSLRAFVALFDLNHWYHSQMPLKVFWKKKGPGTRLPLLGCEFFAFFSLLDTQGCVKGTKRQGVQSILGCQLKSLLFLNTPPPSPEIHMWPSSLAFDVQVLLPTGSLTLTFCGLQRTVLHEVCSQGASALSDYQTLSRLFSQACVADVLPAAEADGRLSSEPKAMRTELLNLALDYGVFHVVESCIKEWSDSGTDPDGCTLPYLLQWATDKLTSTISAKDRICKNLYSKMGGVDGLGVSQLRRQVALFDDLAQVFHSLLSASQRMLEGRGAGNTAEGEVDLLARALAAELQSKFTKVLHWAATKNLPNSSDIQHPTASEMERGGATIIGELLEMATQNSPDNYDYPLDSLKMLLNLHADHLTDAALVDYVTLYYLCDLTEMNSLGEIGGKGTMFGEDLVASYQEALLLSSTERDAVKAFWILDNLVPASRKSQSSSNDAEKALGYLKDPRAVLFQEQHAVVLSSFLDAGFSRCALRYFEFHKDSIHMDLLHPKELQAVLSLLMEEGRFFQALSLCRNYSGSEVEEDCYRLLLETCAKARKLSALVAQELSYEETMFVWHYLEEDCSSLELRELLVLALMRWGYLDEAASLNQQMQRDLLSGELHKRANDRTLLLEGLLACEPGAVRDVWRADVPDVKEVKVETLTALLSKKMSAPQVTAAGLLQGLLASRAVTQAARTPLMHARTGTGGCTPQRTGSHAVFGKKLISSSTRPPTRSALLDGDSKQFLHTPKHPPNTTPLSHCTTTVSRNSIGALKSRLSAIKDTFTLPHGLYSSSASTPTSAVLARQTSLGRPTPRSILKRAIEKASPSGGVVTEAGEERDMEIAGSLASTKRITFADPPPASLHATSTGSLTSQSGDTPLSISPLSTGGDDSFADASDHFPMEVDPASIPRQLQYNEDASLDQESSSRGVESFDTAASELDGSNPPSPAQAPRLSPDSGQLSSFSSQDLGRRSLDGRGDSNSGSSFDLHNSDTESDFLESSFEKEGTRSTLPASSTGIFGQPAQSTSLERKNILWDHKPKDQSLHDSIFQPKEPQSSFATAGKGTQSSTATPSSSSSHSLRFISQESRKKLLSIRASAEDSSPSDQRKSMPLAKNIPPVSSFTQLSSLSSPYNFRAPLAKSPPFYKEESSSQNNEDSLNVTPLKPYAFSPPFTRSSTKKKKESEFARLSAFLNASNTPLESSKRSKHNKSIIVDTPSSLDRTATDASGPPEDRGTSSSRKKDVPSRSPTPSRRSKRLLGKK